MVRFYVALGHKNVFGEFKSNFKFVVVEFFFLKVSTKLTRVHVWMGHPVYAYVGGLRLRNGLPMQPPYNNFCVTG
jgi:hypothetical protein